MTTSRVTPKRAPVCPGHNSRFTVRHNPHQDNEWWVYYRPAGADPIPADAPHSDLVNLVNLLKQSEGTAPGGAFNITEHSQVIARMKPAGGYNNQNAIHVIGIRNGAVIKCTDIITFQNGALDPSVTPAEGKPWPGPLCGTTYTFAAPTARKPPSHNQDEIWIEVNGINVQLSAQCGVLPYPPNTGQLGSFLAALRRELPLGGRFRVNELGRAFTSNTNIFIGLVPLKYWFRPISPTD